MSFWMQIDIFKTTQQKKYTQKISNFTYTTLSFPKPIPHYNITKSDAALIFLIKK